MAVAGTVRVILCVVFLAVSTAWSLDSEALGREDQYGKVRPRRLEAEDENLALGHTAEAVSTDPSVNAALNSVISETSTTSHHLRMEGQTMNAGEVQDRLNEIKKEVEQQLERIHHDLEELPVPGKTAKKGKAPEKGKKSVNKAAGGKNKDELSEELEKISSDLKLMKEDLAQVVHNISDTIDGLEDVEEDQAERDMLISSLEEHLKEHHIDENVQRLKEDGLNQVVDFETGNILDKSNLSIEELSRLQELRREADPAILHHDFKLLWEIAVLIVAAALGGILACYLKLPPALGYIIAGSVVGPSGLFLVKEFQKVETVSLFGSLFILFAHGSTFTVKSLKEVELQYVIGGAGTVVGTMIVASWAFFVCGMIDNILEGYLIGISSALSSTKLAIEFLHEKKVTGTNFGNAMRHIVAVQDVIMGLIMAAPAILAAQSASLFWLQMLKAALAYMTVFVLVWSLTHYAIPRMFELLLSSSSEDDEANTEKSVVLLGMISVCLSVALLTEFFGLSFEAGAFFAGLAFMRPRYSQHMTELVGPLDHLFGSMYFASIGMILSPYFVWTHLLQIVALAIQLYLIKIGVAYGILRFFHASSQDALQGAITLSQLGEFSLLFMSKTQSFSLVSRKLYLVYVVVTATHLGLASVVKNRLPRLQTLTSAMERKVSSSPLDPMANATVKPERPSPSVHEGDHSTMIHLQRRKLSFD